MSYVYMQMTNVKIGAQAMLRIVDLCKNGDLDLNECVFQKPRE